MGSKVFVGGVSWGTTDESLQEAFSPYGTVTEAKIVTDRETGRSRGFGFVRYEEDGAADKAIEGMHDTELDGRRLRVDHATERQSGGRGGGGGGRDRNDREPRRQRR